VQLQLFTFTSGLRENMRVGDLVKWLHPDSLDYGLVLEMGEDRKPEGYWNGQVFVQWQGKPEHSGFYPADHELMEIVSESR